MSRRTCPRCDSDQLELRGKLVARPVGSFSLAGAQMKVSAHQRAELACQRCGWSVTGQVSEDGRHFDPDHDPDAQDGASS